MKRSRVTPEKCPTSRIMERPPLADARRGRLVAHHYEEWYAVQSVVPGIEVHRDADLTWVLQPGVVWSNGGILPRFKGSRVSARLDVLVERFSSAKRGLGIWVDAEATPSDLEDHLKAKKFRCRKYFPGMACDLSRIPPLDPPGGIVLKQLEDHDLYKKHPHPYFGPITTAIRRFELTRLKRLHQERGGEFFDFVALQGDRPVGACTMFRSAVAIGFHDVGVIQSERGTGIGSSLIAHACRVARERGGKDAVLLSSGMGYGVYLRAGFEEVCKIGYWYRA